MNILHQLKKINLFFLFSSTLFVNYVASQSTQLANSICNTSISNLGANITCVSNLGQGHRFEISKTDGTIIDTYDAIAGNITNPTRSKYAFRFTWLTGCNISYGTTYKIRVSWFDGSNWSTYGSYCNITTPSLPIAVASSICGTTISSLGVNITASANQMCGHKWEIRDLSNNFIGEYDALTSSILYPGRSAYNFRFTWMPAGTIQSGTTYVIRVAYYDPTIGSWSAYGPSCNITTPVSQSTQLSPAWCNNLSIPSSSTTITCNTVTGAIQYQFTISATGYGTVGVLTKSSNSFKLNELTAPHPIIGLDYNVEVSSRNTPTSAFSSPGSICAVRLAVPTTTISNSDCGTTINYLQSDTIHANIIPGAEAYRYRIIDGSTTITDTVNNLTTYNGITLNKFPGVEYCKSYQISVQVRVNGLWSDWGAPCTILTVCQPTTELRSGFINSNITSCATNIYVNAITYASPYEYRVIGPNINEVIQRTGSQMRLSYLTQASNLAYGNTYSIECRVFVNGNWCPWGPARNLTLQIPTLTNTMCGASLPTMSTKVYSNSVSCVTDYRFRINGPGLTNFIHNPSSTSYFVPNQLISSGIQLGSTYSVEVSVLTNGVWSNFGSSCNITLPLTYILNNESESFENINDKTESNLIADIYNLENDIFSIYPNPSNTIFKINIENNFDKPLIIKVINTMGIVVEEKTFIDNKEINDFSFGNDYAQGVYLVNLYFGDDIIQKRIVKLK